MSDHRFVPAAAAALAALLAAAFVHAPLQAQEGQEGGEEDVRREEVRVVRAGVPGAEGGWLGIRVEDLDAESADEAGLDTPRGARITGVREESPAAGAGLEEGDVVVRFAGEEVRSVAHLVRLVRETPPGREVAVRVLRDGDGRDLSLEVGGRPGMRVHVRGAPGWRGMDGERMKRLHERMERVREHMGEMSDSLERVAPRVREFMVHAGGPPRLGVRMQALTDQLAEHFGVGDRGGVLVASVREGSAAAGAGLEAGDVIVRFGDADVEDPADLARAVHEAEAGPVSVTLVRDGDERTLTVELPESRDRSWFRSGGEGEGPSAFRELRMIEPPEVDVHWNWCDAEGCRRWGEGFAAPAPPGGAPWRFVIPRPEEPGIEISAPGAPTAPAPGTLVAPPPPPASDPDVTPAPAPPSVAV